MGQSTASRVSTEYYEGDAVRPLAQGREGAYSDDQKLAGNGPLFVHSVGNPGDEATCDMSHQFLTLMRDVNDPGSVILYPGSAEPKQFNSGEFTKVA